MKTPSTIYGSKVQFFVRPWLDRVSFESLSTGTSGGGVSTDDKDLNDFVRKLYSYLIYGILACSPVPETI